MNPEAREELDRILGIEPSRLTFDERAFLRARRDYLKKSQAEEYAQVIKQEDQAPEPVNEDFVSYDQLRKDAKALGFNGGRAKRPELEAFIAEQKQKNPFN